MLVRVPCTRQGAVGVVLAILLPCASLFAEEGPLSGRVAKVNDNNPMTVPTVRWLPPTASAAADSFVPYTESIPGTEVAFDMVPIPGGEFLMGSPDDESDRKSDEGPLHRVRVDSFWMGKYEVTWDEFELWAFSKEKKRRQLRDGEPSRGDALADAITRPTEPFADLTFEMGRDGYPAICMTQLAAKCYCKWLSAKTGHYYRLPTEAEWEYACRAGTTTAYSFGDDPEDLNDYGWYFDNGDDRYHKVGSLKPNPWGLYDMHGNVSEWVLDGHRPSYLGSTDDVSINPLSPPSSVFSRVARGGCWDDDADGLRSAARKASEPDWNKDDPRQPQSIWYHTDMTCPGFRLVRPLRIPPEEESAAYEPSWDAIQAYDQRQSTTH